MALLFVLLRSLAGAFIQAIRDNEEAAASLGVRVLQNKRLIFVLSALGCAAAGALWLSSLISFQPKTYFKRSVDGLHDFHDPRRRSGDIRRADSRRRDLLLIETFFGGKRRLVSGRTWRDSASLRSLFAARPLGRHSRPLRHSSPANRVSIAINRCGIDGMLPGPNSSNPPERTRKPDLELP